MICFVPLEKYKISIFMYKKNTGFHLFIFSDDFACVKDFPAACIAFRLLATVSLDVTPSKAKSVFIRTEGRLGFCSNIN